MTALSKAGVPLSDARPLADVEAPVDEEATKLNLSLDPA